MKKYIYPLAVVAALTAATSCNDDDVREIIENKPDSEKEMISFSLSDEASSTRAGFLKAETSLAMHIVSQDRRSTNSNPINPRYTNTVAAAAVQDNGKDYSVVSFTSANKRYWDDAYGRNALLSVYAVAIPNGGSSIKNNNKTLEELLTISGASTAAPWVTAATPTNTIDWQVTSGISNVQEKDASTVTSPTKNIDQEDLTYANNIQNGGTNGIYRWDYTKGKHQPDDTGSETEHKNGRMLFYQKDMTSGEEATATITSDPGHFDKGHLMFNHALSRISVTLKSGQGFAKAATGSFRMKGDGIQFLNMKVKGTLDIPTGVWTAASSGAQATIVTKPSLDITYVDPDDPSQGVSALSYATVAQMLPDYVFEDGSNTNVMQFTIDNNTYYITQDMIYDALAGDDNNKIAANGYAAAVAASGTQGQSGYTPATAAHFKMMQGKNYALTITVDKKQIEAITATLKAWDDVNASFAQDNSHITIFTSSTGSEHNDFKLFRLEEALNQIYTDNSYTADGFSGNYKVNGIATLDEMTNNGSSYSPKKWEARDWYYKDNKTAYHLRTLNDLAADGTNSNTNDDAENVNNTTATTTEPAKSYFTMNNGAQSTQDYHWGAPMKASGDMASGQTLLAYNTSTGYTPSIHKGFVAPANGTSNPINITELHMMSNINVILKTTASTSSDHINLRVPVYYTLSEYNTYKRGQDNTWTDISQSDFDALAENVRIKEYKYATVKITNLYSSATVDMGTGLVTPTGSITASETMTQPTTYFAPTTTTPPADDITTTQAFTWAVVPQALKVTTGTGQSATTRMVGITITTPDNNEYYIIADLSLIKPSSVGSQAGQMHSESSAIERWYPNHSYTYTFTLSKKGIEAITCTLAEWVTVTGTNTNITLEN